MVLVVVVVSEKVEEEENKKRVRDAFSLSFSRFQLLVYQSQRRERERFHSFAKCFPCFPPFVMILLE